MPTASARLLTSPTAATDVAIVGGGLQGCLLALALRQRAPRLRVDLFERAATLGGNHTWSCHVGTLPAGAADWLDPVPRAVWNGSAVFFPRVERHFTGRYCSFRSTDLAAAVVALAGNCSGFRLHLGRGVTQISPGCLVSDDGRSVAARLVIDCRGPRRPETVGPWGYQKFLGLELRSPRPHGVTTPVIMDARVPQTDGFRFFYVLPFAPTTLLVEDTYYSAGPLLDPPALRREVLAYAARLTGQPAAALVVEREEIGSLPIPWRERTAVTGPAGGYAGGCFHPTTGYSLPFAAAFADRVARLAAAAPANRPIHFVPRRPGRARWVYRLLNRALFHAYTDAERYRVMEWFFGLLSEAAVERFYGMGCRPTDWSRLFVGRPPPGFSFAHWLESLRGRRGLRQRVREEVRAAVGPAGRLPYIPGAG